MNRRQCLITGGAWIGGGLVSCQQRPNRLGAEKHLHELGIILPDAPKPVANYVPFRQVGNLLWVAGQGPALNTEFSTGKVGLDLSIEQGQIAARNAALNILAQLRAAAGSLARVKSCVKLGGFVNCVDGFTQQPKVINGASDLMVAVFGDAGKHARFAVGANALPFNISVEIESVWELFA